MRPSSGGGDGLSTESDTPATVADHWAASIVVAGPGYWRFPLAVLWGQGLRLCTVEIMAANTRCEGGSGAGPTIVLHECCVEDKRGLVNWIEEPVELLIELYLHKLGLQTDDFTWLAHLGPGTEDEAWTRFRVGRVINGAAITIEWDRQDAEAVAHERAVEMCHRRASSKFR